MMNRRTFLSRLSTGLATTAMALHLELGSLAPVLGFPAKKETWWYLIEENIPFANLYDWNGQRARLNHVRWIDEDEMLSLGLTHEDFAESWDELSKHPKKLVARHSRGGGSDSEC
jgi:hypothetical protein